MFHAMALSVLMLSGAESSSSTELKQLDMMNSWILPGGGMGITPNVRRIMGGYITKDKYIKAMIAADEDIAKLNNNPTPSKTYKQDLQHLKEQKTNYYGDKYDQLEAEFRERNHIK